MGQILPRDLGAEILNEKKDFLLLLDQPQQHPASLRLIFQRIFQKAADDAQKIPAVPPDKAFLRKLRIQGNVFFIGQRFQLQCRAHGKAGQIHTLQHHRGIRSLHIRKGQHLTDQLLHPFGGGLGAVQPAAQTSHRGIRVFRQNGIVCQNHRQRRFQIMGGIRHKLLFPLHSLLHGTGRNGRQLNADGQKQQHGTQPDSQQHQSQPQHRLDDVIRGSNGDPERRRTAAVINGMVLPQNAEVLLLGNNGLQQRRYLPIRKSVIGRQHGIGILLPGIEHHQNILSVLPIRLAFGRTCRMPLGCLGKAPQRRHHLLHGGAQSGIVVLDHIPGHSRHHNGQDDTDQQHIELHKPFPILAHGRTSSR